jgi:beta-lactamase regulating signal transducer with metallopeptidase domain
MSRRTPPDHLDPKAFAGLTMRLERRRRAAKEPSLLDQLRHYTLAGIACAAIVIVAVLGSIATAAQGTW